MPDADKQVHKIAPHRVRHMGSCKKKNEKSKSLFQVGQTDWSICEFKEGVSSRLLVGCSETSLMYSYKMRVFKTKDGLCQSNPKIHVCFVPLMNN